MVTMKRNDKKIMSSILLSTILSSGCTTTYFIQNSSDSQKKFRLVYDKCINPELRKSLMTRLQRKNKISGLTENCRDSICEYSFNIEPRQQITMTEQFAIDDPIKMPLEKRLLYVEISTQNEDTIYFKRGNTILENKFSLRSKFSTWLGKRVYYYNLTE